MQTRPVEVICTSGTGEHTNIKGQEMLKILRNSPCPPASTLISFKEASEQAEPILQRYFQSEWPEALRDAFNETNESKIALGLCLVFLDKLLLADVSIPVSAFEWNSVIDEENLERRLCLKSQQNMIIDAQAIEHLDILPQPAPASKVYRVDGSLFSYLSQTS